MSRSLRDLSIRELETRYLSCKRVVSRSVVRRLRKDPRRGVQRICDILEARIRQERAENHRLRALLRHETLLWDRGLRLVAGVDEAGMGPLAGPVVAAAVIFDRDQTIEGVDDSKKLLPEARQELASRIRQEAVCWAIGRSSVREIRNFNIYHAGLLAMKRAIRNLPVRPEALLVDGRELAEVGLPQVRLVNGDQLSFAVASASILAKTERDRTMNRIDLVYPFYGLAGHKGYSTKAHQKALRRFGPSPIHRPFSRLWEICGERCSDQFLLWSFRTSRLRSADQAEALLREARGNCLGLLPGEKRRLELQIEARLSRLEASL